MDDALNGGLARQAIAFLDQFFSEDRLFIGGHFAEFLGAISNQYFAGAARARSAAEAVNLDIGLLACIHDRCARFHLNSGTVCEVNLAGTFLGPSIEEASHGQTLPAYASRGHY